jgi:ketosteroid isomerase-like protein
MTSALAMDEERKPRADFVPSSSDPPVGGDASQREQKRGLITGAARSGDTDDVAADNVEVVRRWHAAMSAGSDECLKAIDELCDPDIDFYPVRKFPEARPCHGREEFSRFFDRFWEGFPNAHFSAGDVFPVGDDRVLACGSMRAEGGGSGITLEGDLYTCHWIRHGRFLRVENHLTLTGALHALGLEGGTLEEAGLREDNLEVFRRQSEAFDRRDRAAWLALHDEDFEIVPAATFPEVNLIRGPEAGWDYYLKVTEPFEQRSYSEHADARELGEDKLVVHLRSTVRGQASGIDVEMDYWIVVTFRDGRVLRDEWFAHRAEALAAAGVSE